MRSDQVKIFFDEINLKKMPAYVKMHSPVCKTRVIRDRQARNFKSVIGHRSLMKDLQQALNPIQHSFPAPRGNRNVPVDLQRVTLTPLNLIVQL
jgi:hypothetical protein